MVPTFDIEAMHWTVPIAVGYFVDKEYHEVLKTSEDCDVIWEFLKELSKYKGLRIYAHNAANYDNRFILDSLTKHQQTVRFLAGLGRLVWVEANVSFEDSYLILGRPLAAVCEALDVPRKLEWKHDETENIWDMKAKLDAFRTYLKRDVLSLSEALDKYSVMLLDLFGVTPSVTMSLTAVKAFGHRFYPLDKIDTNQEHERFIRAATYGGRNEVYRRYGENILMYDVRGMYVSCYDTPVPIGKLHWGSPGIDRGVLAEAKVKVPDMPIGPLPHRYHGRLAFPVGEFQDFWDMVELRSAVEKGVDLTLIRQLQGEEAPVLKDFGTMMENLRQTKNEELSRIWKIFGLRLSGKFGQNRTRTEIKHSKEIEDFTGFYPIDENEIYHERQIALDGSRSPYIKPAVNMRIRAEARVRHLNKLLAAKDLYYCDNDSVYTTRILPCGDNLGDLHLVGFATRAYFIGCKFYGYIDENSVMKQKTSGFSDDKLNEYDFEQILKGRKVNNSTEIFENWKEILKGKGVNLHPRKRSLSLPELDNRIMDGIETRPIKLPEP